MSRRYAEGTEVPVDKTKNELDKLLRDHGATQRAVFEDDTKGRAIVRFTMDERMIQLEVAVDLAVLPNPKKSRHELPKDMLLPQNWSGLQTPGRVAWVTRRREQLEREAWRRCLLITKAKLEVVANGSSVEREFLADLLLPDGSTVHKSMAEGLARAYSHGEMPRLLPGSSE